MALTLIASILLMGLAAANAQTAPTKDTTIAGKKTAIYTGSHGGRYVLVVSRTGNTYKKYLPKNK